MDTKNKLKNQQWQDTLDALEEVRAGQVVDAEIVHNWLRTWGTVDEYCWKLGD